MSRVPLPADVADRLAKFKATLLDEVHEVSQGAELLEAGAPEQGAPFGKDEG